jgi:hypothetical protein
MFQFPWLPLPALCVQAGVTRHDPCQVFPFGDPRIEACLAAPRGLSQPATSFIGFQRLDIHRVPFATCRDDARARYGVLKGRPRPADTSAPAPTHRPLTLERPASGCGSPPQVTKTVCSQPSKLHSVPDTPGTITPAGHNHPKAVPPAAERRPTYRIASDPRSWTNSTDAIAPVVRRTAP